jgi:hypothetical protein
MPFDAFAMKAYGRSFDDLSDSEMPSCVKKYYAYIDEMYGYISSNDGDDKEAVNDGGTSVEQQIDDYDGRENYE